MTIVSLGVFLIASCDNIQNLLNNPLRNLGFVQEALKADAAKENAIAGSLSAEGGSGALVYSLVSGVGDDDNGQFTVSGNLLTIKAQSLDAGEYRFRAQVKDGIGQTVEGAFTLTVTSADDTPADPLRNLGFVQEALKADAAKENAIAGSLSAEGGSGALVYSLVSGAGDDDNGQFTVSGNLLTIKAQSLAAGDYRFRAQVKDGKDQAVEGVFTLTVASADGPEGPGAEIAGIIEPWRGVWYSKLGSMRLDGYRVGRWSEIKEVMGNKLALFPQFDPDNPRLHDNYAIQDNDYFIFCDDTVYGEDDNGEGGNGGWDGFITRYIGIVRAVNVFNDNPDTGAVIVEFLGGCYPQWAMDVVIMPLPFFGMYYRVVNPDLIRMANAVDLAALSAGRAYYTETATLQEAIDKNNVENEGNFISWGVVIPQQRN
jgi:hypothetical protein